MTKEEIRKAIDEATTFDQLHELEKEIEKEEEEEKDKEKEVEKVEENIKIKDVDEELKKEVKETEQKETELKETIIEEEKSLLKDVLKEKVEERKMEDNKNEKSIYETKEYRRAFLKKLQNPARADYTESEKRALTTAITSVGYAVPTETLNAIEEVIIAEAPIYQEVEVLRFKGYLSIPVEDTIADASWISEGSASVDSNDKLGVINFAAYKLIKTIAITAEVANMTIDAFESWIVKRIGEKMAYALDKAIISGAGTTEPTGILNDTTVNKIEVSAIDYKTICDMLAKNKSKINNKVVMSAQTLYGTVAQILDGNNRPIFIASAEDGFAGKLMGIPVVIDDNVTEDIIILGNLKKYTLNFNQDIIIDKNESVDFRSGNTVYRGMALVDGKVRNKNAFIILKKASV